MNMKSTDIKFPNIFSIILIICILYLGISILSLFPYTLNLFKEIYIIEPNDLPKYSDVFNSIFTVLNIIISSILSYMVYNLYKTQYNATYNKDIASSSIIIYYTLKYNILNNIVYLLEKNLNYLIDEEYIRERDKIPANSIEFIQNLKSPSLSYTNNIQTYVPNVIGYIRNTHTKNILFTICEDLMKTYSLYKNKNTTLVYMLPDNLINNNILIKTSSKEWVYILNRICNDQWSDLSNDYKELMETLLKLSKTKQY
ncbi:hypothetical protein [Clostridium butyricum]|uniref:hypothetical protein n=1 Tax=Clostridium butyricum TaxID=1492 RepID=UPI00374F80C3